MDSKPLRFSHSQDDKFRVCPWSWKRVYMDKDVPRGESEASLWGVHVHEAVEAFVKTGTPLPVNVTQAYGSQLQHLLPFLMQQPIVQVEPHLGITEQGEAVDPEHESCWAHGFIDIVAVRGAQAWIADWKTGKSAYPSDQLKLYAAMVFAAHQNVMTITVGYVRLQHNRVDSMTYQRDQVEELLLPYRQSYARRLSAIAGNSFPKISNPLCRGWCDVGSTCEKYSERKIR